jgi:hypothetical protein
MMTYTQIFCQQWPSIIKAALRVPFIPDWSFHSWLRRALIDYITVVWDTACMSGLRHTPCYTFASNDSVMINHLSHRQLDTPRHIYEQLECCTLRRPTSLTHMYIHQLLLALRLSAAQPARCSCKTSCNHQAQSIRPGALCQPAVLAVYSLHQSRYCCITMLSHIISHPSASQSPAPVQLLSHQAINVLAMGYCL